MKHFYLKVLGAAMALFSVPSVLGQCHYVIDRDTVTSYSSGDTSSYVTKYNYNVSDQLQSVTYFEVGSPIPVGTDTLYYNTQSHQVDSVVSLGDVYSVRSFEYNDSGKFVSATSIQANPVGGFTVKKTHFVYDQNGQIHKIWFESNDAGSDMPDSLVNFEMYLGNIQTASLYTGGQSTGLTIQFYHTTQEVQDYVVLYDNFLDYVNADYTTLAYPLALPNDVLQNIDYAFYKELLSVKDEKYSDGSEEITHRTWKCGSVVTGILDQNVVDLVSIAPNPSTDGWVSINLPESATVDVYASTGTLVATQTYEKGSNVLSTESLGKGLFLFKIKGAHVADTKRVIIK